MLGFVPLLYETCDSRFDVGTLTWDSDRCCISNAFD